MKTKEQMDEIEPIRQSGKELKPCPFCGSSDIRVGGETNDLTYVWCGNCQCETDVYMTAGRAIRVWNARIKQANEVSEEVKAERDRWVKNIEDAIKFSNQMKLPAVNTILTDLLTQTKNEQK
jgi:Lar family restriction alleviation protein